MKLFSFYKRFLLLSFVVFGMNEHAAALESGPAEMAEDDCPDLANSTRFGPQWASGMVWYQVFPERFANGNPGNDPREYLSTLVPWDLSFDEVLIEEIERAWFLAAGEPERFGYDPYRTGGSISNVIFQRRYGGDLQGVFNALDQLQGLGIEGIYLCPIFSSSSLHKYDAADHRHIDPTLGDPGIVGSNSIADVQLAGGIGDPADESTWGWTAADRWFVDVFVPETKARGMRLMLDGVWNHVGLDHWAFADVIQNGSQSRYADWFEADFNELGELVGWEAWNGPNGSLPVFRQTETGDLAPGPKAHMMAVTRRWMDPNGDGDPSDGIDGWRLDVAGEIGRPFWKDWRAEVKELNPECLIVGEIWHDAREYFDGTAFDSQMNYPAAYALADWLSIGHMKGDSKSLASRLTEVFSHEPETDRIQLNLMTSHDTERLVSLLHNSSIRGYDNQSHPWHDQNYDKYASNPEDLSKALVAFAVLMASPGGVMIYNGDEFAMTGADDPDNRRPIPERYLAGSYPKEGDILEYRDRLGWILRWVQDADFGPMLRFGDARFEASLDGLGIRIVRIYRGKVLVADIGPCGTGWEDVNLGDALRDDRLELKSAGGCWSVRLRVFDDIEPFGG